LCSPPYRVDRPCHRPDSPALEPPGRAPERDAPKPPFVVGVLQASQELGRDWLPL
jgi:hypothetical protein